MADPASAQASREPYLGFVATGCLLPASQTREWRSLNAQRRHFARARIIEPRLIIPNFLVVGGVETGPGAPAAVKASIFFRGTFYPATFSGADVGEIADGDYIVSDPIAGVDIPAGAAFHSRLWWDCAAGIIYNGDPYGLGLKHANPVGGEGVSFGASTQDDLTRGGTLVLSDDIKGFGPLGIIATTTRPSALIVGDSIGAGLHDSVTDGTTDIGIVARAIGPHVGYCNVAVGGERLPHFIASHDKRVALGEYSSHVVLQHGTNDVASDRTVAQLMADQWTIRRYFPDHQALLVTTLPRTGTNTTTMADQAVARGDDVRIEWNRLKRLLPEGYDGVLDLAALLEAEIDVNNTLGWKTGGYTDDGTHPSPKGNALYSSEAYRFRAILGL